MRLRGNVRTGIDISRLRQAVSGPGVDPREWLVLATVTETGLDPELGLFVELQYMHSGTVETAYLGSNYSGEDFGDHNPLDVGDTILIANPMGDPAWGGIVIARWHDGGEPPNAELQSESDPEDFTRDRIIRIKPSQKLKIRTSGTDDGVDISVEGNGDVVIEVVGTGQVKLGDRNVSAPLQGVVNGESINPFTGSTYAALGQASNVVAAKKVP